MHAMLCVCGGGGGGGVFREKFLHKLCNAKFLLHSSVSFLEHLVCINSFTESPSVVANNIIVSSKANILLRWLSLE